MKKTVLILITLLFIKAGITDDYSKDPFTSPIGICKKIGNIKPPEVPPNTNVYELLKSIGFTYKLGASSQIDELLNNSKHMITQYLCIKMPQLENAVNEIKRFVEKNTQIYSISQSISVMPIYYVLQFYNSNEYQIEVKRIMNKYCWDCRKQSY